METLNKNLSHCNEAFTLEVRKKDGKLFVKIMRLLESSGFLQKAFGPDVNLLLSGQYAEEGNLAMRNDCLKIRNHRSIVAHAQIFCMDGLGDIDYKVTLRYNKEDEEKANADKAKQHSDSHTK